MLSLEFFVCSTNDHFDVWVNLSIDDIMANVIYIYTQTCVRDGTEMRRNLFVDLLAHKRNGYR
jgi:hypothetical protein